ncbi:MAG: hypothetical protein DDT25_01187 [Chloroflexi bacterium]|nr:hypothetical protein [Chloroflexota bacterium]
MGYAPVSMIGAVSMAVNLPSLSAVIVAGTVGTGFPSKVSVITERGVNPTPETVVASPLAGVRMRPTGAIATRTA